MFNPQIDRENLEEHIKEIFDYHQNTQFPFIKPHLTLIKQRFIGGATSSKTGNIWIKIGRGEEAIKTKFKLNPNLKSPYTYIVRHELYHSQFFDICVQSKINKKIKEKFARFVNSAWKCPPISMYAIMYRRYPPYFMDRQRIPLYVNEMHSECGCKLAGDFKNKLNPNRPEHKELIKTFSELHQVYLKERVEIKPKETILDKLIKIFRPPYEQREHDIVMKQLKKSHLDDLERAYRKHILFRNGQQGLNRKGA